MRWMSHWWLCVPESRDYKAHLLAYNRGEPTSLGSFPSFSKDRGKSKMGRSSPASGLTWEGEQQWMIWMIWNKGFVMGIRLSTTVGSDKDFYRRLFALTCLMWAGSCCVCRTDVRALHMKWEKIKGNWNLWDSTGLKDKPPGTWGRWRKLCGEIWSCYGPGESHVNKASWQISDTSTRGNCVSHYLPAEYKGHCFTAALQDLQKSLPPILTWHHAGKEILRNAAPLISSAFYSWLFIHQEPEGEKEAGTFITSKKWFLGF